MELIQEVDGDIWGAAALNLNHLGFWVEDVEKAAERLQEAGLELRMVSAASPPRFAYLSGPGDVWVELCGPGVRTMLSQWLSTAYQGPDTPPVPISGLAGGPKQEHQREGAH